MPKAKRVGAAKGKGRDITPVDHKSIISKFPKPIAGRPQNEVSPRG